VDFWKLINWLIVSAHWGILADLGQTSPTTYMGGPVNAILPHWTFQFANPIQLSQMNNIFVNETLFMYYVDVMKEILQFFDVPYNATFSPLNDANRLEPREMTFRRSYICNERRMKSPISATTSILIAEYAFLIGGYSLFIFVAAYYQKRKAGEGKFDLRWWLKCIRELLHWMYSRKKRVQ
jgi:hypothetical protein